MPGPLRAMVGIVVGCRSPTTRGANLSESSETRDPSRVSPFSIPHLELVEDAADALVGLGPVVGRTVAWPDVDGAVGMRTAIHTGGASVDIVGVARFAVDDGDHDVVRALAAPGRSAGDVRDAYERSVVPLVLTRRGAQYLHASAVLSDRGVIALCGRSGTGKSTMAAALELRGYRLWGDDAMVFARTAPVGMPVVGPLSVRLPSELRLDRQSRALAGARPSPPSQRPPVGSLAPLAAVVVLQRGGGRGLRVRVLSSAEALTSVLEHALCLSLDDEDSRRELAATYLELVALVPVVRVEFVPGPDQFAALTDALAARADPPARA